MPEEERISCVIITNNEERNIGRCIKSIEGLVDEIIVIDSFSTDKTEEICKEYNVKFVQMPWKGYSFAKNYGNSLAVNPYILSVDADEALSEGLKNEILNLKTHSHLIKDAYYFNRLTNYCGTWIKHCGWYPDTKLRMWKKEKGEWEGLIHEKVVLTEGSSSARFKNDLLHFSYYTINEHIQQMNYFTDLMALDNYNKGIRPNFFKIVFSPVVKFIKSYFILAGFLDGNYGLTICILSGCATFLKYAKTIELYRKSK